MVFRLRMIFREEVNIRCNLGEGLAINYMKQGWEKGLRKGMKEGLERGMQQGAQENKKSVIRNMYADDVSMENMIKWAGADENLVEVVIAEYEKAKTHV